MSVVSLRKNPYGPRKSVVRSAKGSKKAKGVKGSKARGSTLRILARLVGRAFFLTVCLGLLASFSVGLLWGYRAATTHAYFGLTTLTVQGNSRLETADVVALSGLTLGQNTLALKLDEVRERLGLNPWVESAQVRRVLPDGMAIEVTERQAAFWVLRGDELWYADAAGSAIAPVEGTRFAALPLLTVRGQADVELDELLAAVAANDLFFGAGDMASLTVAEGGELTLRLESGRGSSGSLVLGLAADRWLADLSAIGAVMADLARRGELSATRSVLARGRTVVVDMAKPMESKG